MELCYYLFTSLLVKFFGSESMSNDMARDLVLLEVLKSSEDEHANCSDLERLHPLNKVIDLGARAKHKKKLYIEAVKTFSL